VDKLSPLAWLAIAAIIVITVAVNLLMVSLLRSREKMDEVGRHLRSRGPSRTVRAIQSMREIARDPFKEDRKQLDELSKMVARIQKTSSSDEAEPGPQEK